MTGTRLMVRTLMVTYQVDGVADGLICDFLDLLRQLRALDVFQELLAQVADVARRHEKRVELGELRVGRHPRQRRLQLGERAAQHAHPVALALVRRVTRTIRSRVHVTLSSSPHCYADYVRHMNITKPAVLCRNVLLNFA